MMRERGLEVGQTTIFRWVRKFAPGVNKRVRTHLKLAGAAYRLDETYIKGILLPEITLATELVERPLPGPR